MANNNQSKKTRSTRRLSKAELERKKAIHRMIATILISLVLVFAALKLGAVGVLAYNLIRLFVGSLAGQTRRGDFRIPKLLCWASLDVSGLLCILPSFRQ